jgi:hypothetical protein
MSKRRWYTAEVVMPDLTTHTHTICLDSEDKATEKMRDRYPEASVILVYTEAELKQEV